MERGGWISLSNIGKAGFGYLETVMERRGLDALKLYWKGGVGYLETVLERRGLDTLQQCWKGGVWIPPEIKDNLNSSLSFEQLVPIVFLSESIAYLLA